MAATYEGAPRTAEEVAQCKAETGQPAEEEEEEEEGKDHARQMATDSSDSNGVWMEHCKWKRCSRQNGTLTDKHTGQALTGITSPLCTRPAMGAIDQAG